MASKLISLGAINKSTQKYEYPRIANKQDTYVCPDCQQDLILCQGSVYSWHFRHRHDKELVPCTRYDSPSESQIHKDAKNVLQSILQQQLITIYRVCHVCYQEEEYELPPLTDTSSIVTEFPFRYDYSNLFADVAFVENNKDIVCLFEVFHTHRTHSSTRPEPWFEFNATDIIHLTNQNNHRIPCIRLLRCDDCVQKVRDKEDSRYQLICSWPLKKLVEDHVSLEFFVRYRLGQRFTQTEGIMKEHLRFDFHSDDGLITQNNYDIISLFRQWLPCDVSVWGYKGILNCFRGKIPPNTPFREEDLPVILNGSGMGTVPIIIKLITDLRQIPVIKYISDDTADTYRSLRCEKQEAKGGGSNYCHEILLASSVAYTLKNNIITIKHPTITECSIRYGITSSVVFIRDSWDLIYGGKWVSISLKNIISWYKSTNGILYCNIPNCGIKQIRSIPIYEQSMFVGLK